MKKSHLFLMIDTETANTLEDGLVYDIGIAIIRGDGKIINQYSFVIYDIYVLEKELMQNSYYNNKLPIYETEIKNGNKKIVNFFTAQKIINNIINKYSIRAVLAHNMPFDYRALNTTLRYITKSKKRYFFPNDIKLWDTLTMARSVLLKDINYKKWCIEHNFLTSHKTPQPKLTAEVIYRYITNNIDFIESHMGIEDVLIEKEIFSYFIKQKKKMNCYAFTKR